PHRQGGRGARPDRPPRGPPRGARRPARRRAARDRRDGVAVEGRRRQHRVPRALRRARPCARRRSPRRRGAGRVSVRRVGLVPHPHREKAAQLVALATERLGAHDVEVRVPVSEGGTDLDTTDVDVVISLGGDGTMLRAVDTAYEAGVPVLGVNVGQMGYLTEVEPSEFDAALDRLVVGDFEVAERMVLEMTVESSGSAKGRWFALNAAVLEKAHTGRLDARQVQHNSTSL